MAVLADGLDTTADTYRRNREAMLVQLDQHGEQLALATAGGGPRYVERSTWARSKRPM